MQKVFAILVLIPALLGCSQNKLQNKADLQAAYNENSPHILTGDFDGDKENEHINLSRSEDGTSTIVLRDKNSRISIRKIGFDIIDSSVHIEDVNRDGREDLIIYVIDNSVEKLYVFSFNGLIYELLSPEIFEKFIDFKPDSEGYLIRCGNIIKQVPSSEKLYLNLYFTDYDYDNKEFFFTSEGSISNLSNKTLYTLSLIYSIDKSGSIQLKDFTLDYAANSEV